VHDYALRQTCGLPLGLAQAVFPIDYAKDAGAVAWLELICGLFDQKVRAIRHQGV